MCADHMYPPLPREPLGASQLGLLLCQESGCAIVVECRGRWILIGKVENKQTRRVVLALGATPEPSGCKTPQVAPAAFVWPGGANQISGTFLT